MPEENINTTEEVTEATEVVSEQNVVVVQKTNELTLIEEIDKSSANTYTSVEGTTNEEKKIIFNAMNQCDKRVSDCLNTTIYLKDLLIQKLDKVDEKTGEVSTKYRSVLIDKDGVTYASASHGLYLSLLKLIKCFGTPNNWSEPIAIEVVEVEINKGKTYNIVIL